MIRSRLGKARNTIITIPQYLDPQTMMLLKGKEKDILTLNEVKLLTEFLNVI